MDKIWLAKRYFSGGSSTSKQGKSTTSSLYAYALSDSTNGTVTIEIDNTELDVPCVGAVSNGQRVLVSLVSGSPVVIGASGWGDQVTTIVQKQEETSKHLYYDSSRGLVMCLDVDYPDLGISTQIQSTGFSIRSDTTKIAEFTPATISLGRESDSMVVSLINGTGEIRQTTRAEENLGSGKYLDIIAGERLRLGAESGYLSIAGDAMIFGASEFFAGTPVFAACTATSTEADMSLTVGEITQVTLTDFAVKKGSSATSEPYTDSRFEISGGGVRCCAAGYVLVSGSVYVEAVVDPDTGQSKTAAGCYVYRDSEEVAGAYFVPGVSTAIKSGAIVVDVAEGDVLTLRTSASENTSAVPSDKGTYLSVVYV